MKYVYSYGATTPYTNVVPSEKLLETEVKGRRVKSKSFEEEILEIYRNQIQKKSNKVSSNKASDVIISKSSKQPNQSRAIRQCFNTDAESLNVLKALKKGSLVDPEAVIPLIRSQNPRESYCSRIISYPTDRLDTRFGMLGGVGNCPVVDNDPFSATGSMVSYVLGQDHLLIDSTSSFPISPSLSIESFASSDYEIIDVIKETTPDLNFLIKLLQKRGWTYGKINKHTMEVSISDTWAYYRPDRNANTLYMVKNEDYFLSIERVVDFLRLKYGFDFQPLALSAHGRTTRHGRIISDDNNHQFSDDTNMDGDKKPQRNINKRSSSVLKNKSPYRKKPHRESEVKTCTSTPTSSPIDKSSKLPEQVRRHSEILAMSPLSSTHSDADVNELTLEKAVEIASKALSISYIPSETPARNQEIAAIKKVILDALDSGKSTSMYVAGLPGLGKTAAVSKVLQEIVLMKRGAGEEESFRLSQVLGASVDRTQLFIEIATKYGLLLPESSKASDSERLVLETIRSKSGNLSFSKNKKQKMKKVMNILVIDEIDMAPKEAMKILFDVSNSPDSSLILIGIGNNTALETKLSLSSEPSFVTVFKTYTDHDISSIIKNRTFKLFEDTAIDMISKKVVTRLSSNITSLLQILLHLLLVFVYIYEGDIRAAITIAMESLEATVRRINSEEFQGHTS
jgi:hypothetical protein